MKKCQKCKQYKPFEEFHRNKTFADGRAERCKQCRKVDSKKHYDRHNKQIKARMYKYYHNGGKEVAQKRHSKPEVQDMYYTYKQTPEYKRKTQLRIRKPGTKEVNRKYYQTNKLRFRAYAAVAAAIRKGTLKHPKDCKCSMCSKQAVLYHHHSYDKQYWLDIIPLCERCHHKGHNSLIEIPINY